MPLPTIAFPCCCAHDLYAPVEDYAKSILHTPGDATYWFNWRSSFHGSATVSVAKRSLGSRPLVLQYRGVGGGEVVMTTPPSP